MVMTLSLALVMMAGLFLLLLAGVGYIQDPRYFSSAPQAIQDAILPKEERFAGQHALGWLMGVVALFLMVGPLVYGGLDGMRHGFGLWDYFLRFMTMLLLLKAHDICFFDWYLLCHSDFFPRYYPECASLVGPQNFWYNLRSHLVQVIMFVPASLLCALLFMLAGSI